MRYLTHTQVGSVLLKQIEKRELYVLVAKVFKLDQIVESHKCMEAEKAGGKIVVLT